MDYYFLKETDSTNHAMRELLVTEHLSHGTCVYTDFQTAGRGQGNNFWEAERGKNIVFSLLIKADKIPIQQQFLLSELMAVSICKTLRTYLPNVELKWPNDIYIGDKKLGGILIETIISAQKMKYAIIGVGINVNQEKFLSDAPNPTSILLATNKNFEIRPLLSNIIDEMTHDYDEFEITESQKLQELYHDMLYRRDGYHKFADNNGEFEAAIVKVEDNGRIHLRINDKSTPKNERIRSYWFKEVRFII